MCHQPEIWEKLPRDPRYRVSSHGRVRGVFGKLLSTTTVRGGYLRVHLGERKIMVHRLVLEAFTGNCPPGFGGVHLDGDKTNNHATNLAWRPPVVRRRRGRNYKGRPKLTVEQVEEIRRRAARGESVSSIARSFPFVSRSTVSHARHGRNWGTVFTRFDVD